jgi:ribosome-associated toxin RatA of RatAB toxin-antitoxin module
MQVRKTVLAGYSAERMFDLIEAAEHYPAFLPWCSGATIVERDEVIVAADITVDYHGVRFQFRTRNPKRRPEWMSIRLEHGPFRHFEGEWNLKPLGADGCRIGFELGYDFKSTVMSKLAGPVFDRIANTLVDAFVARADVVYRPAVTETSVVNAAPVAPAMAAPTDTQSRATPDADPNRSQPS